MEHEQRLLQVVFAYRFGSEGMVMELLDNDSIRLKNNGKVIVTTANKIWGTMWNDVCDSG